MELIFVAIGALAVLIVASLFSRRTGVAAPLILLAVGAVASYVPWVPQPEIEPEWILAGVLPPLLYASAVQVRVRDLKRNFGSITLLSVVAVVGSALAVGALVHWLVPSIPFAAGVALGAVVSPTDAVAATAIGSRLGLPDRLMGLLEGESLLNDASALVLLRTALAALSGGFTLGGAIGNFLMAVGVAILVGAAVGLATVWVRQRISDPVLTTAISFTVPFLSYLPAEELNGSGVVAVVTAGLITGAMGASRFSARERTMERTNWATVQFFLENGVFLLMGLQLRHLLESMAKYPVGQVVLLVTAVVLVLLAVRVLFVALSLVWERGRLKNVDQFRDRIEAALDRVRSGGWSWNRFRAPSPRRVEAQTGRFERVQADLSYYEREQIGPKGGVILAWAGMRGVVTLAAALTIPASVPNRDELVVVAFLVAVVSLVLFGGTLPWVIRAVKLPPPDPEETQRQAMELAKDLHERAGEILGPPQTWEVDGKPVDPAVLDRLQQRVLAAKTHKQKVDYGNQRQQQQVVQARYLSALREALREQMLLGAYPSAAIAKMTKLLDAEELRTEGT